MNEKRLVLKSQKNDIFVEINKLQLNPAEFAWQEIASQKSAFLIISKLVHIPSGYFFEFDFLKDEHYCRYSPAEDMAIKSKYPVSWELQYTNVKQWLSCLKIEIWLPDYWEQIFNDNKDLNIFVSDNISIKDEVTVFNPEEQKYISQQLIEINEHLNKIYTLNKDQSEYIKNSLVYLVDASNRVTRKDWKLIFIGKLVDIISQIALPSNIAKEYFKFAINAIIQLFTGQRLLP